MRPSPVHPTGVERTFGADELIVSKTDPRGVITYANHVFARVARYSEVELIHQPHSIVRHPDMPRAVFKLLWDTITAGQEIFAYVLNLASDGAHYWVLAHVTPSFGPGRTVTGYHSSRRSPDPGIVAAVRPIYALLLAEEQRHERPHEALEASTKLLTTLLADAGMTYEEFVWSIEPVAMAR